MEVAEVLGAVVKSLLGNSNSVKYVVDADECTVVVSDALQLLQHLDIEHPIGDVIYQACRSHHAVHGTGTKTLLCLIGVWTKSAIRLRDMGVPVPEIIQLMHSGIDRCLNQMEFIKIPVDVKTSSRQRDKYNRTLLKDDITNPTESRDVFLIENSSTACSEDSKDRFSGVECSPVLAYKENVSCPKSSPHIDPELTVFTTSQQQQQQHCFKPTVPFILTENSPDLNDGFQSEHTECLRMESHPGLDVNCKSTTLQCQNLECKSCHCCDKMAQCSNTAHSCNKPDHFQQHFQLKTAIHFPKNFQDSDANFHSNKPHYTDAKTKSFDFDVKSQKNHFTDSNSDDEFADCFADIEDKFLEISKGKSHEKASETISLKKELNKNNVNNFLGSSDESVMKKKEVITLKLNMTMTVDDHDDDDDDISWFFTDTAGAQADLPVPSLTHSNTWDQMSTVKKPHNSELIYILDRDLDQPKDNTDKRTTLCENTTLPALSYQTLTETNSTDNQQSLRDQSKFLSLSHSEEMFSSLKSLHGEQTSSSETKMAFLDQLANNLDTHRSSDQIQHSKSLKLFPTGNTEVETKHGTKETNTNEQIKNLNLLLDKMKPISATKVKNCSRHFKTIESSFELHNNAAVSVLGSNHKRLKEQLTADNKIYLKEDLSKGNRGTTAGNYVHTTEDLSKGNRGTTAGNYVHTTEDLSKGNNVHTTEDLSRGNRGTTAGNYVHTTEEMSRGNPVHTTEEMSRGNPVHNTEEMSRGNPVHSTDYVFAGNHGPMMKEINILQEKKRTTLFSDYCRIDHVETSSTKEEEVSYGFQQIPSKEDKRISDMLTLVSGLSHGRHRAMSLVMEVISLQNKFQNQSLNTTIQFDLTRLHTSIASGLGEEKCGVIDGLILDLSPDQLTLVYSWTATTIPTLLINGSIHSTFKHKGYKPPVKVRGRFTSAGSRAPEPWIERIKRGVHDLGVKLLLLTGSMDDDLKLELECNGVIVAEAMKYNLLAVAAGLNSWQILTYLEEASQEDVCYMKLGPIESSSGQQPALHCSLKPTDQQPVWTILLCHPSHDVARIREQEVWKCAWGVSSALSNRFILPGGGETEKILADFLLSDECQEYAGRNAFQPLVFEEIAKGLLEYQAILDANVNISRYTDVASIVINDDVQHTSECEEKRSFCCGENIHIGQLCLNVPLAKSNFDIDLKKDLENSGDQFVDRPLSSYKLHDMGEKTQTKACQQSQCSFASDNKPSSGGMSHRLAQEQINTTDCEHLSKILCTPLNDKVHDGDIITSEMAPSPDVNRVKSLKGRSAGTTPKSRQLSHDLKRLNVSSLDGLVSKQSVYSTAVETVCLLLQCDRHITTGITTDTLYSNIL